MAAALVLAILVVTPWAWAGMKPDAYAVTVGLSALLAVVLLAASVRTPASAVWRDPLFTAGLLFLAYLCLQWWNSGRALYFDVGWQQWRHTPPPHPGWPSGFDRVETAQMVGWFFPPWSLALALRSAFLSVATLMLILRIIAVSAGLLSFFGIVQYASGTASLFWLTPLECPFFASFGYANHAASFFLMTGALAAGLLCRDIIRRDRPVSRFRVAVLGGAAALCLVGVNLSLSRAGFILSWVLAFFATGYVARQGWLALPRARRITCVMAAAGTLAALALTVTATADFAILKEFGFRSAPGNEPGVPSAGKLDLSLGNRTRLLPVGWRVWGESPWFGAGGWGFRHRSAFHLPSDEWGLLEQKGGANVHCDPLQFGAEFGVIGAVLGLSVLACLLQPLTGLRVGASPVALMGGIGLALVSLLSLIDIPFRCPAILITWSGVLAVLPRVICRPADRSSF